MCTICDVELTLDNFSMRDKTAGKIGSLCKSCKSKQNKAFYAQKKSAARYEEVKVKDQIITEKTCAHPSCLQEKHIHEFSMSSHSIDGYNDWCKTCVIKYPQPVKRRRSQSKPRIIQSSTMDSTTVGNGSLEVKCESDDTTCVQPVKENVTKRRKSVNPDRINARRRELRQLKQIALQPKIDEYKKQREAEILEHRKNITHRTCNCCNINKLIDAFAWENKMLFIRKYKCMECGKKNRQHPDNSSAPIAVVTPLVETFQVSDVRSDVPQLAPIIVDQDVALIKPPSHEGQMSVDIILSDATTKKCSMCNATKDKSEFAWKNKSKGLYESKCKPCNATFQKDRRIKSANV